MDYYPKHYYIASGIGSDLHPLVAFDQALINAGISNYNLLKVSSILPAGAERCSTINVPEGMPLLTAYATISSIVKGTQLVSVIGAGIPMDSSSVGVIMEFEAEEMDEAKARSITQDMIQKAMFNHGIPLREILLSSASGVVADQCLSLISAISLF